MNTPPAISWFVKTIALALLVPAPVGLFLFSAIYLSRSPESAVALLMYVVPPIWLILIAILGRTALDAGESEAPKGELEVLLQKKQHGDLQVHPRPDWHKPQYAAAPTPKPVAQETGPALDQLIAWKRTHCPASEREVE